LGLADDHHDGEADDKDVQGAKESSSACDPGCGSVVRALAVVHTSIERAARAEGDVLVPRPCGVIESVTEANARLIKFILRPNARTRRPERHDNSDQDDADGEHDGRGRRNEFTHRDRAQSGDQVGADWSGEAHEQVLDLVHVANDRLDDVGTARTKTGRHEGLESARRHCSHSRHNSKRGLMRADPFTVSPGGLTEGQQLDDAHQQRETQECGALRTSNDE
jgi:hypothetical protein